MESFEHTAALQGSFRNSLVEDDTRLNSRLGSMIQPGSMVEVETGPTGGMDGIARWGDENSIEEYDEDGIPQVDVYVENVERDSGFNHQEQDSQDYQDDDMIDQNENSMADER